MAEDRNLMEEFHAANRSPMTAQEREAAEPELFSPPGAAARDDDLCIMWWDGDKFDAALAARGLTKQRFSELLGVRRATVSDWAHGNTPSMRYILEVADLLGLADFRQLFTRDAESETMMSFFAQNIAFRERMYGNGDGR